MNASNDSRTGSNSQGSKGSHFGWTFANACILGMTAWIAFSSGGSPFASRAEAGTPPTSARNATASAEPPAAQALDSGFQRAEMVSELQAMRREMAEMRALLSSGGVRAEISNISELGAAIEAAAKTR